MSETAERRLWSAALADSSFQSLLTFWEADADREPGHLNLQGPGDSQKAFLLAALQANTGAEIRTPVIITADEMSARQWEQNLQALTDGEVRVFRPRDYALTAVEASSRDMEEQRLAILRDWLRGALDYLIVPGSAMQGILLTPDAFRQHTVELAVGDLINQDALIQTFVTLGYERRNTAEEAGEFARRGDIIDFVPPGQDGLQIGFRLSFFDEEIDQLKRYDTSDQRTLDQLEKVTVYPAREVLLDRERLDELLAEIDTYRQEQVYRLKTESNNDQAVRVQNSICDDMDALKEGRDTGALDRWLPLLYPDNRGLYAWIEELGSPVVADEVLRLRQRMDGHEADHLNHLRSLAERGQLYAPSEQLIESGQEIFKYLDRHGHVLTMAVIASSGNGFPGGQDVRIGGREAEGFRGHESRLWELIRTRFSAGELTFISAPVAEQRQRLREELAQEDLAGQVEILQNNLARGFEYPAAGLYVLGSQDVFGREKRNRRRKSSQPQGQPIAFFSDLEPGDPVVHEVHGIGHFEGLSTITRDGSKRDYLKISYAAGDSLFIPMEGLDQIQKYVGMDSRKPKLSRLGGTDWNKLKDRARSSIRMLAVDLVKLYAERQKTPGFQFDEDTVWEKEFAESFPYVETEDQLRCIQEVKEDMCSTKVMDRLLCGDVGFGKTEVAFRAMFKAVVNGKQTALMAPTTVLAQQHYENFLQRVGEFPVKVGHLSRFATDAEQKKTIAGLKDGSIDVVIGTHRILSKDVVFKRLGLLVVDEEQRFGVDHKEKLKQLTPNIDVLTLTATPIPRTLHMSLSGIRDISIIEEPPEDRRPVQTYVMPFDEPVVTDAILREVGRGGQVFYLFNDTRRIPEEAKKIEEAIPGIRVNYAHGKMSERILEDVIQQFVDEETDVLVCTTIIESGIDMPNVNTMIVTNADRLGLAQMYQLRGRVGRSSRQAYAYITYKQDKILNEDSEKRLTAIREFTELGSGFKIALRDLEVRGAGNLLGGEQHGHLESIGYELYMRMLDEEVKRAQAEAEGGAAADPETPAAEPVPAVETVIDLSVDALLSPAYIPDAGQRMAMYRKIVDVENYSDVLDVLDELADRFGDVPASAARLVDISYVRAQGKIAGFSRISLSGQGLLLEPPADKVNMESLSILMGLPEYKGKLLFNAGRKPHALLRGAGRTPSEALNSAVKLFRGFEAAREPTAA